MRSASRKGPVLYSQSMTLRNTCQTALFETHMSDVQLQLDHHVWLTYAPVGLRNPERHLRKRSMITEYNSAS